MSKLKQYFSYPKFANPKTRILYLFQDYWLQRELINCFESLDHSVYSFKIIVDPNQMLDGLLKACIRFKPDIIIGTNHLGFDPEGKIARILSDLKLPVAFWYLDDFRFIIQHQAVHANDSTILFVFDKNYQPDLEQLGFPLIHYLPLGTPFDPTTDYSNSKFQYLYRNLTFIGSSFHGTLQRWEKPGYNSRQNLLAADYDFTEPVPHLVEALKKWSKDFHNINDFYHFAGFVAALATQKYRQTYLQAVEHLPLQIFGDKKWCTLNIPARINPSTVYQLDTPAVYRQSQINLNLSSQQLDSAVNQRVFDVAAVGGFLLTDWKDSLPELFDIDTEVACFRSKDEMNELIDYYSRHPAEREKIIARARKRITANHLLIQRASEMLSVARKVFK